MKKVIISDFDDTLYINNKISSLDIDSINHFIKTGGIFIIATGSSYTSFKRKIKGFDLNYSYLIVNHGTSIFLKDKLIYNCVLDSNVIKDVISRYNLNDASNYTLIPNTSGNFFSTANEGLVLPSTKDITKIHIDINKNDLNKELDYLNTKYGNIINMYDVTGNGNIEIISKETSKLIAIEKILNKEEIQKDNVYTIGDGYSDLEMIKKYKGYAMANSVDILKDNCIKVVNSITELIKEISYYE